MKLVAKVSENNPGPPKKKQNLPSMHFQGLYSVDAWKMMCSFWRPANFQGVNSLLVWVRKSLVDPRVLDGC